MKTVVEVEFGTLLAGHLREARKRGHTQRQLADALIVNESDISDWKRGVGIPNPQTDRLERIAAELGLSQEEYEELNKARENYIGRYGGVRARSQPRTNMKNLASGKDHPIEAILQISDVIERRLDSIDHLLRNEGQWELDRRNKKEKSQPRTNVVAISENLYSLEVILVTVQSALCPSSDPRHLQLATLLDKLQPNLAKFRKATQDMLHLIFYLVAFDGEEDYYYQLFCIETQKDSALNEAQRTIRTLKSCCLRLDPLN